MPYIDEDDEISKALKYGAAEISRLHGRINQLENDAQLAERAMRAALACLEYYMNSEGYIPLPQHLRATNLLKSALHQ